MRESHFSTRTRVIQVACAIVWCLFAAGPVFGFAALKPVLISEGVYHHDHCTKKELHDGVELCSQQELKLNRMFTYAAVLINMAALPVGYVLDKVGPRFCGMLGAIIIAMASGLLANADKDILNLGWDYYMIGYILLALGGPFVFISVFHLSNTFPRFSGTILALITGAFDSSSAVFLGYRFLYDSTEGGISVQRFFTGYLVVPAFIFLAQLLIMPKESYTTVGDISKVVDAGVPQTPQRTYVQVRRFSISESTRPLLGAGQESDDTIVEENTIDDDIQNGNSNDIEPLVNPTKYTNIWGALHEYSAWGQIKTPWFILMAVFTTIQMLTINYFLATVYSQYSYLLGDPSVAKVINKVFDLALPIGGVISVPFIGMILDNFSTPITLWILFMLSTIIGTLGLIPSIIAAFVKIGLLVIYRPFYYTSVSDYSAKVFGFENFGTVYGLMITISGALSLSQVYLDEITHTLFDMNPIPVNALLLIITAVSGGIFLLYIHIKIRRNCYEPIHRERFQQYEDGSYSAINE